MHDVQRILYVGYLTHYGHVNIIKYVHRPYPDADAMNEALIANWNAVVRPGDRVYHLGDFAFCFADRAAEIAHALNGNKYLVWGNHDKHLRGDRDFLDAWIWAKDLADIKVGDQRIVLCHYPMLAWNQSHRGAWHLHGHSHGSLPDDPHALRLDVGVDCCDFRPIAFEELKVRMDAKEFRPVDHHG